MAKNYSKIDVDPDFNEKLTEYIPALRRYAYSLYKNSRAEDLTQDVLERALAKKHLYTRGTNLKSWLYKIMYNMFCNQYKRNKRMSNVELGDIIHHYSNPSSQMDNVELQEIMENFKKLPEKYRSVINLVIFDGLSYKEVADILGIAIGTVKSRLYRAREKLADNDINLAEAAKLIKKAKNNNDGKEAKQVA
jgi:RNA polymerase sigma-70 factor (ECF subfamily)